MPADIKAYLSEISVVEVSLCGKPMVPQATIQVMKSAEAIEPNGRGSVARFVPFTKVDEERKQVLLYVLVPDLPHHDGEAVRAEWVERACHSFMTNLSVGAQKGTGTGVNHQIFDGVGNAIESAIDVDGSLGRAHGFEKVYPGAWLIRIQCTDETWGKIKKGEITGVSMGGFAKREPVEKSEGDGLVIGMMKSYLKKKGYFMVKAIDFNSSYAMQIFYDQCPDMWDSLLSAFWSIMYDDQLTLAEKTDAIEDSLGQFAERIRTLLGTTEKSDNRTIEIIEVKNGGEELSGQGVLDMQISEADLKKMIADNVGAAVTEAVDKAFSGKVDELKKAAGSTDDLQKSITDLTARLDKLAKGEEGEITATMAKAVINLNTKIENISATLKKSLGSNVVVDKADDADKKPSTTDVIFKGLTALAEEKLAASA